MPLALTCRSPMTLQFLNVLGVPIPENAVALLWDAGRRSFGTANIVWRER